MPTGRSAIGTVTKLYTDPSRRDALDPTKSRSVLVQFWYPSNMRVRGKTEPYMSRATLGAIRADQYLNVDVSLLDGWDRIATHSYPGTAGVNRKCPLLLFSPGVGMSRASYTTIAEELASRGIIVGIADHPYCGLSIYPDGNLRSYMAARSKPEAKVIDISRDQSFILTSLQKSSFARID